MIHDLRYALRTLSKSPGFTLVVVLTLALGIAANSTIFSWISSTLLNPIPGATNTPDFVTVMRGAPSDHPTPPFSYLDFRDLRDRTRTFAGLLAYHHDFMSLTGAGKPERIYGVLASANYFDVLGVRPILGRGFLPIEEQQRAGAAVAVIGYGLWQSHFAQDPLIIGKIVEINRHPYTIVGVAPREFRGSMPGLRSDVWIPLTMDQPVWGSNRPDERDTVWLNVLGKLRPADRDASESEPVTIVNQALADRYWPGQDVLGKHIRDGDESFTVVGLAANAKYRLLTYAPEPILYLPMYQTYRSTQDTTIHLRAFGDPQSLAFSVERVVHELNPELPLFNVNPLRVTMRLGTIFEQVASTFSGSFGLLAMLLAVVGVYGVVAYTTRQRTREIGIRMALGAGKRQIYRLVLGQGVRLMLAGLLVGVALSLVLTRFLQSKLYGVSSADVLTYGSVAMVLSVATLAACHIPARRATRVEPTIALHCE